MPVNLVIWSLVKTFIISSVSTHFEFLIFVVFFVIYDRWDCLSWLKTLHEQPFNWDFYFLDLCAYLAIKCLINKGLWFTLMIIDLPGSYSSLANNRQHVGLLLELKYCSNKMKQNNRMKITNSSYYRVKPQLRHSIMIEKKRQQAVFDYCYRWGHPHFDFKPHKHIFFFFFCK